MDPAHPDGLVTVAGGGPASDGIVFDTPSRSKVVVVVVDPSRGPVFRTVHPSALTERTKEGADDPALRLLIRRTPPPVRAADGTWAGQGHSRAGHTRGSMHRTTGK